MRAFAFAIVLVGCGAATVVSTTTAATTRHRVGDYVVYRYAGRLIGIDPMHLMREVVAQDGDRLVIEVTLTRGHDTVRAWRETLIDDASHRVDSVCRIEGETCTPIEADVDAALVTLHEGLFVPPDAPPTDSVDADEAVDVGGTTMSCHVHRASITREGEPLTTKDVDCPDFVWRDAGSAVEMPDKRRVLRVTVESYGVAG